MKFTLTLLSIGLFAITSFAQTHERCATTHVIDAFDQHNPGYKAAVDHLYQKALDKIYHTQNQSSKTNSNHDTIFRIPVVFHMVYTDPNLDSLDEGLVYSQMDVLNRDFRRLNADTVNTRQEFRSIAGDVGVEFYLATTDPQGNPTTGITYTLGNPGFFGFEPFTDNVKSSATGGADPWPTDQYLNIWVCNILNGLGVLGYAFPPAAAPNWPQGSTTDSAKQGVVIHYAVFGENNPNATGPLQIAAEGRTGVHEVGHFLGLRHVWGDGDCTEDDGINDTPLMGSNSQQAGCSFTKNTCDTGMVGDLPDMVENYMDYSTEQCQNMFTKEQIAIMRSMLVIGRPGLADIVTNSTSNEAPVSETIQPELFPNPSNGRFTLRQNLEANAHYDVKVLDITGKAIFQENGLTEDIYNLNLEGQPQGLYILQVEAETYGFTRKLALN
jgi:hypothetical protein